MTHRTEHIRYGWCLHCETVWRKDYLHEDVNGFLRCPKSQKCGGSAIDLWDYDDLRERFDPPRQDMPFEPLSGSYISQYPREESNVLPELQAVREATCFEIVRDLHELALKFKKRGPSWSLKDWQTWDRELTKLEKRAKDAVNRAAKG